MVLAGLAALMMDFAQVPTSVWYPAQVGKAAVKAARGSPTRDLGCLLASR